mmetsp:Transcript_40439/g.77277  ORF Transcript_40439/g.77277 Transcript_40439/m.77277 type:complete len:412 (-) Transcript_40439:280-1515(-)
MTTVVSSSLPRTSVASFAKKLAASLMHPVRSNDWCAYMAASSVVRASHRPSEARMTTAPRGTLRKHVISGSARMMLVDMSGSPPLNCTSPMARDGVISPWMYPLASTMAPAAVMRASSIGFAAVWSRVRLTPAATFGGTGGAAKMALESPRLATTKSLLWEAYSATTAHAPLLVYPPSGTSSGWSSSSGSSGRFKALNLSSHHFMDLMRAAARSAASWAPDISTCLDSSPGSFCCRKMAASSPPWPSYTPSMCTPGATSSSRVYRSSFCNRCALEPALHAAAASKCGRRSTCAAPDLVRAFTSARCAFMASVGFIGVFFGTELGSTSTLFPRACSGLSSVPLHALVSATPLLSTCRSITMPRADNFLQQQRCDVHWLLALPGLQHVSNDHQGHSNPPNRDPCSHARGGRKI